MTVLDVIINGKRHSSVGISRDGALSAVISLVTRALPNERSRTEQICLELGASQRGDNNLKQTLQWKGRELRVGDEVVIRIRKSMHCDAAESTIIEDQRKQLRAKKAYFKALKKELKASDNLK